MNNACELQFQLFTVVAYDAFQNGIPCLWILMERHEATDLITVLRKVKNRLNAYRLETLKSREDWRPNCFLVDDAKEENLALRDVFPEVPVNLCLWYVRRAWLKKLHSTVKDPFQKAEMNRALGNIMYCSQEEDPWVLSEQFMVKWKDETSFMQYYEKIWHSRIERWAKGFRSYAHGNQDSQGSIERWHATLKQYLRGSRKEKSSRRVVWLITQLTDSFEPFYYCTSELKRQGHIRNRIVTKHVKAAIRLARDIPDCNVIPCTPRNGMNLALVINKSGRLVFHEIKCLIVIGGFSKLQLLQRLGIKWGTTCGGVESIIQEITEDGSEYRDCNVPVENLDIPTMAVSSESEGDDDCVIIAAPANGSTSIPKLRPLGDFQREVVRLYSAVSHSTYLCSQAFDFLLGAVNKSLDLKATREVHDLASQDDSEIKAFTPVLGNENTLKRKMDFMELFHKKKKSTKASAATEDWSTIDDDNRFQKIPTQTMSMQQVLDKATHSAVDINVAFTENKPPQNAANEAPLKNRASKRGIQRKNAYKVGVENVPPEVILIE
ncbi:hypothetical protein R1sor_007555 [Riccia sorocarpa]|uniref:MULE transposase domain-containing protein n=1 Tax=Riccia sorocarpa TaxID=122646 RepID=A0ABD3HX42_9MARC